MMTIGMTEEGQREKEKIWREGKGETNKKESEKATEVTERQENIREAKRRSKKERY